MCKGNCISDPHDGLEGYMEGEEDSELSNASNDGRG